MPTFSAYDGTELVYHLKGDGKPLVCLPGGAMRASAYLDDLGGLSADRQLVLLDLRGTGDSAAPADTATYRCDRQVDDVEALREHLGLAEIDLLGHSAAGNLAMLYAARFPDRVGKMALITATSWAVGISVTPEDRLEIARLRKDEPWFDKAFPAFEAVLTGRAPAGEEAHVPFFFGRWDATAQANMMALASQTNDEAAALYASEGAFDPPVTRAALERHQGPVLVLAGEVDGGPSPRRAAETAALFPHGELAVQPGAGHFPWQDDPEWFARTVSEFFGR